MSFMLSIGLSILSRLMLVMIMLSTVCLLRAAILFTIAATIIAVWPLAIRIARLQTEAAGRA